MEDSFFVFFLVGLHSQCHRLSFVVDPIVAKTCILPSLEFFQSNANIVVDVVLDNDMHWVLPFFFLDLGTSGRIVMV